MVPGCSHHNVQGSFSHARSILRPSAIIFQPLIPMRVRICDFSGARNLFRLLLTVSALCGINSALRNWPATSSRKIADAPPMRKKMKILLRFLGHAAFMVILTPEAEAIGK